MREPGVATAAAVVKLGGPASLAEWLYRSEHDGAAALRECPRADWLLWLAAADGATDGQLLAAGIAATRTVLPLVHRAKWPLAAALEAMEGMACARVPTAADLAFEIVNLHGVEQRVALAVRSVRCAMLSHRMLATRILALVVATAALTEAQVRHGELAALSATELTASVDRAWRAREERELQGTTLPLGLLAVLRYLRALVPTVRPLLERVDASTDAG